VSVSYQRELDECLIHTVTGCSQRDFTVYNETIIRLRSAAITQLCTGHQQQQQQQQLDEENGISEQG